MQKATQPTTTAKAVFAVIYRVAQNGKPYIQVVHLYSSDYQSKLHDTYGGDMQWCQTVAEMAKIVAEARTNYGLGADRVFGVEKAIAYAQRAADKAAGVAVKPIARAKKARRGGAKHKLAAPIQPDLNRVLAELGML